MISNSKPFYPGIKDEHTNSTLRLPYVVNPEISLDSPNYDGIILINNLKDLAEERLKPLSTVLSSAFSIDKDVHSVGGVFKTELPSERLIYSPTGFLNIDYDDVRSYHEAGSKGIKRALKAGVTKPLLVLVKDINYPDNELVTLLGVMEALYTDIQTRENNPSSCPKVASLGVFSLNTSEDLQKLISKATVLESSRWVARDIGGGDPERMAPSAVEAYVKKVFAGSKIQINVVSKVEELEKSYPLFAAVNRAASVIKRHEGRVIWLKYSPAEAKRSIVLVGKGVTYDTGGTDIKYGGSMVGMHRDKCGAAAVAGFLQTVNLLEPSDVSVIGALCMVRNSVGENSYVADEIIVARSGSRVRVGNTDAEGRMAMADILCEAKELSLKLPEPQLFTIATLTGHAKLYTDKYTVVMNNAPARKAKVDELLRDSGKQIGDPFEISTLQREDFHFHKGDGNTYDLLQANNKPSVSTPRGHQGPGAFLVMASGLNEHGLGSNQPLKYSHLDIAASSGNYPGTPSGTPILALAQKYLYS